MKKVLVFGSTSLADTVTYYIENFTNWTIAGYVTDYAESRDETHNRRPVINSSRLMDEFPPSEYEFVSAVGYINMMDGRKNVYQRLKGMGYSLPNLIHPTCITNAAVLGEGNIILENVIFEPFSSVGNDNIFWTSAFIGHNCIIEDHSYFAARTSIASKVSIEECCFLGNNSTIRDKISIAHHTLIGAGAYVSKDTQPYDVLVPARSVLLKHKSTELL